MDVQPEAWEKGAKSSAILLIALVAWVRLLCSPMEDTASKNTRDEGSDDEGTGSDGHGVNDREVEFVAVGSRPAIRAVAETVLVSTVLAEGIDGSVDVKRARVAAVRDGENRNGKSVLLDEVDGGRVMKMIDVAEESGILVSVTLPDSNELNARVRDDEAAVAQLGVQT